jgi:hypothetical protein
MERTGWVQRPVALILRSRWPTLVVIAGITALAAFFATRITLDTSLETWFLEDADAIVRYKEFRGKFGEDEFVVLGVEAENVFTPEVLGELERLTGIAEEVPLVRRATSLTNVVVMRRSEGSFLSGRHPLYSDPLMGRLPQTLEEASNLQEEAASYPLVAGSLVADDGRMAAVLVELSRECDTFEKKAGVVRELRELARQSRDRLPGITIRTAGTPVVSDAISRYLQKDLSIVTPACFVVVVVSIYLLFRRLTVPLISATVVGVAILWVLGVMGMLGVKMNLLGPVLILIVLVVGVADSVHIYSAYFRELEHAGTRLEALDRALGHVLVPCFVTSLTTIAGFLSLLSSDLEPIRHFGTLAALGTGSAFLVSVFLIPASIQLLPERRREPRRRKARSTMDRLLGLLGRPTPRVAWMVLILSTLIVVPGIWSIQLIKVTANPMHYFHADDPVRADAEAIDAALGGSASLELIVRAPGGGLTNLRILKRLDVFEKWLEQRPAIGHVMSFGALLKEADRVQRGVQRGRLPRLSSELRIPRIAMQESSPELLQSYVRDDFSLGRISARVQGASADELVAQAPIIEQWVETNVNDEDVQLQVEATGFVKLMDDMRAYLIRSQVTSIILAFATITLMLCVLFRSWKLALFSMIPNVGPIVMGLALMAVLGIRLDPGTVMIATIALGLVVDDTCHFLVRLRTHVRNQMSLPDAIAEAMDQTGRPIILTSMILAAGFAVLLLGSFTPTLSFGLVSTFVLLAALVADLVVLPAALLVLRPKL